MRCLQRAGGTRAWVLTQPVKRPRHEHARVASIRRRQQSQHRCSTSGDAGAGEESEELWQQLWLLKRKMQVAADEDNFEEAASLRDELREAQKRLPLMSQYVFQQLQKLQTGSTEQQVAVITSLGSMGDARALPELLACLHRPELHEAAFAAVHAVFLQHPDPRVVELMQEGCRFLELPRLQQAALDAFERVNRMAPSYAEGHNKRATALYLLKRFEESIVACQAALELQPDHFLAMSGMGLCYIAMQQYEQALPWFERALAIDPSMNMVLQYAQGLRARLRPPSSEQEPG